MKHLLNLVPGRIAALCFSFFLLAGLATAAEDEFEGRVKMEISVDSGNQAIEYFVKGDRMRLEIDDPRAQGGVMLMDVKEKQIQMLMPSQKMYMTMEMPEDFGEDEMGGKPEPTGKSRKILGYEAKEYRVKENGEEYEIWATDELGAFSAFQVPGEGQPGSAPAMGGILGDQQFFPLLIIEHKKSGRGARVEVTEVEKKRLDEKLFEIPSGYQGVSLPMGR